MSRARNDGRAARIPSHPRYRIGRRLGAGGGGAVYLAQDLLEDSREVALKVSHSEIAPEEVLREFRLLRELRHPGIARALDFGRLRGGGRTFFTMEYVRGPSLAQEAAGLRRRLGPGSAGPLLDVFLQIAEALSYLHGMGLLHLDIKPANVVFAEGRAKLIDFGLFQNVHLQDARRPRGTALFTAPEVFDGGPLDARTDLYSLGVTFYHALTGEYPFGGRSVAEIADGHRRAPPPPPRGAPEGLTRITLKLLAKAPGHRYQSAGELWSALRSVHPSPGDEPREARAEEPSFVGRKRELDRFFIWMERLRKDAAPALLLVQGEPGAGKSRFVAACVTELLGQGFQVFSVKSLAGEEHGGLRRVVEQVTTIHPLGRELRARHAFLLTLLGIRPSGRGRREISSLELGELRSRASLLALDLLDECVSRPAVLLVEDLHRADAQLRDFLERLARRAGSRPDVPGDAAPAAAEHPGERRSGAGPLGVIATSREPFAAEAEVIQLGPLSRREAIAGLRSLDPRLGAREAARLAALSRGNPGLLVELQRASRPGARGEPLSRSRDLADYLRARLAGLDDAARLVALHLALLARPAGEPLLRRATGLRPRALRAALRELRRLRLVEGSRGASHLVQDLLEDATLRLFPPPVVVEARLRLGRSLLGAAGRLHEAARHLLQAGSIETGLDAARRGGAELKASGRVEEAIALYTQALEHARGPGTLSLRRLFLEELGDLEERSGRFDEAGRSYDRLLEEAELEPAERLRILRKRGGIHQRSGDSESARRVFDEALRLLEATDDADEHLHLLNEIAAFHLFRGEFPRSTTFANRGLEILRSPRGASLKSEARALHALNLHSVSGHILLRQFEYDRAASELRESLRHAERQGDVASLALILNNLGIAYHQTNRLDKALDVYRRATALARRMGDETALFSIQCNVAAIRARLGEVRRAAEILDAVEGMLHPRRSKRARLFFVHSKGLVERLALRDARAFWEEAVRLATALPDPLFASYEMLYLLDNEIDQGRWASARKVLKKLHAARAPDPALARAVTIREALLDALSGRAASARSLLLRVLPGGVPASGRPLSSQPPSHIDLWNSVRAAAVEIETGDLREARARLERTRRIFDRTKQPPGALECALLLAELHLRRSDPAAARQALQDARAALSRHDTSQGSRAALIRIPFLEARAGMQSPGASRTYVSDRLVDAAGSLPLYGSGELAWLLDLAGVEHGEPGARRRLAASRERFLAGLLPRDRKAYAAREHRVRLGLAGAPRGERPGAASASASTSSDEDSSRRLEALLRLRGLSDPGAALDAILDGLGARSGAIFLDGEEQVAAWRREAKEKSLSRRSLRRSAKTALSDLSRAALGIGSGPLGSGQCTEIRLRGRRRLGVLYADLSAAAAGREPGEDDRAGLLGYLDLAAEILAGALAAARSAGRGKDSSSALLQETSRTRTLPASAFVASESPRMEELLTLVQRTRDSHLPVLLTGESGSGKDHLARWIHTLSPRRDGPFVGQDCCAIPEGLLEAELFGHEAGAFTGAESERTGLLLEADGGTFYLDNADSLSLETQAKLLRVIASGKVRPVGGRAPVSIDVRFIASTQRDLKDLCAQGSFRDDLYFRLAGISLFLPPLRERAEDIPLLVRHFQAQLPGRGPVVTAGAIEALKSHSWPGNVRELESFVRRLALTAEGAVSKADALRILGAEGSASAFPRWVFEGRSYEQVLGDVKREYLLHLFALFEGDIERIAAELGTTKRNVYLRFSQAGLKPVDLRARGG
jgi:DNA-binding NtrC family response regulator/tetratricopeptide (TPR) repeat protein